MQELWQIHIFRTVWRTDMDHEHLIERAVNDGIDVIVTCDNGIAAYNEITMAKERDDGDNNRSS